MRTMRRRWPDWWRLLKVGETSADFDFPPSDAKVSFDNIMIGDFCKFSSFFPDYADFLRKASQSLKEVRGAFKQVEKVKAVFNESEALSAQKRLLQQIILAILNLQYPKEIGQLAAQLNIPLLGFKTADEVVSYLDAVIRSGTSVDEKSGSVFLMGNTAHYVLSYVFGKKPRKSIQLLRLFVTCLNVM